MTLKIYFFGKAFGTESAWKYHDCGLCYEKRAFDTLPLIAPWWNISHRWWFAHYWLDNMESIDIGYVTQNHFILITCGYHFIVTSVATDVWFLTQDDFWYMIFIGKKTLQRLLMTMDNHISLIANVVVDTLYNW